MTPEAFCRQARQVPHSPTPPPNADRYGIGLVGCGGITGHHLEAYRSGGLRVEALFDVDAEKAIHRRDQYFPAARVCRSLEELLAIDTVEVVDIATHPPQRPPLIEQALKAGKHVLSQKPFVTDLEIGERLCDLADDHGCLLVVNQNARWAPHFAYARLAVERGLLGEVAGVHFGVHWDHSWVRGTPFEKTPHLILFDYAIHWFDLLGCLIGEAPEQVIASTARTPWQPINNPLLAQAAVQYPHTQASLCFDANIPHGGRDHTFISGRLATLRCFGPGNSSQSVVLDRGDVRFSPRLAGKWFPDAFLGPMSDLLGAIETGVAPSLAARANLQSLALCFAAVESAKRRRPVKVGDVRSLPSM